jgi:plastocyanin
MQLSSPLLVTVLAATLALPAVASPRQQAPAPATAAGTRTVQVADDRYAPKRLTVAKGTRIEWVWSRAGDGRHNVYLDRRPKGAPAFHSPLATAPFSFARTLRKPGTYKFLCTLHEKMRMRIDVDR